MSLPYIPLYVDDYEADTAHLTIEEDGAYNRLLRLCWRTEGCSLPDDPRWIMRKMRISADDYYRVVEPLIDEFFTRGLGRVFHARLQREHQKAEALHAARSEAGKRGNSARWGSEKNAMAKKTQSSKPLKTNKATYRKAIANGSHPEPEPEPEPIGVKPLTPLEILNAVLSHETAADFIAHRKAMKKPVTEVAAKRIVSKLKDHPNPDACVDESIANGWQGIFPEKGLANGKPSRKGDAASMAERIGAEWAARFVDSGEGDGSS